VDTDLVLILMNLDIPAVTRPEVNNPYCFAVRNYHPLRRNLTPVPPRTVPTADPDDAPWILSRKIPGCTREIAPSEVHEGPKFVLSISMHPGPPSPVGFLRGLNFFASLPPPRSAVSDVTASSQSAAPAPRHTFVPCACPASTVPNDSTGGPPALHCPQQRSGTAKQSPPPPRLFLFFTGG
jgi:hypothetical protein